MIIKTRLVELCGNRHINLSELAKAMAISEDELHRVLAGKQKINEQLISSAIGAFPGYRLDDLFYMSPD
jgi:plasmid maintenance system antidote protein VapI